MESSTEMIIADWKRENEILRHKLGMYEGALEKAARQIVKLKSILQPMRDQIIDGNKETLKAWDEALK